MTASPQTFLFFFPSPRLFIRHFSGHRNVAEFALRRVAILPVVGGFDSFEFDFDVALVFFFQHVLELFGVVGLREGGVGERAALDG